jgi:hypothetical protein
MNRILTGKARHALRAISSSTYLLFSPALALPMADMQAVSWKDSMSSIALAVLAHDATQPGGATF